MITKRQLLGGAALAASAAMPVLSPTKAAAPNWPDMREAKAIAKEGFIYGLPIVMNYAVMNEYSVNKNSGQYKAPFNQIKNEARVFTYKDTAIITPNSDTPYSFAWLDLRAEPIVLSVPAVEKPRYYAVMLEDGNTFVYGYIGSRATGNDAGDYMVVGPDWNGTTPPGIKKVFQSTTQFSLAGYRTQLFNPADMDNVKNVQASYKVQTLSAYLKQPAPPASPAVAFPEIDKEMVKTNFFEYLDFSLQFAAEPFMIGSTATTLGPAVGCSPQQCIIKLFGEEAPRTDGASREPGRVVKRGEIGIIMANSSPPTRANTVPERIAVDSRSPTSINVRSPTSWP